MKSLWDMGTRQRRRGWAACAPTPPTPKLLTFLREAVRDVRRVASICIGAFILAEAGILDGGA